MSGCTCFAKVASTSYNQFYSIARNSTKINDRNPQGLFGFEMVKGKTILLFVT